MLRQAHLREERLKREIAELKEENQNMQAEIKANGESMRGMRDCIINLGGNLKDLGGTVPNIHACFYFLFMSNLAHPSYILFV